MSKKFVVNFTTDELKKLVDDETSCVTLHKSVFSLQLYPYHLSDISASIKELLNAKVAKYDKILNGILLGYKNIKLLTTQGNIICDSCYIHIDIEGDFYMFKPEIDSLLTGIVNKKSDNHVGCLVHRLFNVSVPNTDEEDWAGNHVSVGDEVVLKIGFIDLEARLPYIKSKLIEIKTKAKKKKLVKEEKTKDLTDFQTNDETPTKKKKKKDKLKTDSAENSLLEESNNEELDASLKKKRKKMKKEIHNSESLENSIEEGNSIEEFDTSLKKKKNKIRTEINSAKLLEESNTSIKKKIRKEQSNSAENSISNNNGSDIDLNNEDRVNSQKEKKKKRKSTEMKNELNNSKSKKGQINMNGHVEADIKNEEINSLRDSDIIKQILNDTKSPKEKKKRKSKEHKSEKESTKINIQAAPILMADAEDRKTKKRKSSFNQTAVWENKELDLYDSDLEKTLGDTFKPEESVKFNLVKIAALNESNQLKRDSNSLEDFKDKHVKKRKRKSSDKDDGEQNPKKRKQESKEPKSDAVVKKKSKTKIK